MATRHVGFRIRPADLSGGGDQRAVSGLVEFYLRQTESEKTRNGVASGPADGLLPARYQAEVQDPTDAYRGCRVLLAEVSGDPVGIGIVRREAESAELKRLCVLPGARGRGIGAALLDAALRHRLRPFRLTVWDWRLAAIRLYESRGFTTVPSWEERERLLCMELR